MKRGVSLIPIAIGALAGALVAVMQAPKPNPAASAPLTSATGVQAMSEPEATLGPRELPRVASAPAASAPVASAAVPSAVVPSTPVASATEAASATAGAPKPVFDLTEPTDAATLLETQVACNRSVPEACERAARALESGGAGTKDPTRAKALKRIALTLYVKQCEGSRPAACARLAEMYEVGETVQKNEKSVQGLRTRVQELCKTRPNELGCAAP